MNVRSKALRLLSSCIPLSEGWLGSWDPQPTARALALPPLPRGGLGPLRTLAVECPPKRGEGRLRGRCAWQNNELADWCLPEASQGC